MSLICFKLFFPQSSIFCEIEDVYKRQPRSYQEAAFSPDCWLFFGKETAGLPLAFRERFYDRCIRLPMISQARSLNLSNTVAVCVYEALRQNNFPGLLGTGEMAGSR